MTDGELAALMVALTFWMALGRVERRILAALQRLEQRISPVLPENESRDDDADN